MHCQSRVINLINYQARSARLSDFFDTDVYPALDKIKSSWINKGGHLVNPNNPRSIDWRCEGREDIKTWGGTKEKTIEKLSTEDVVSRRHIFLFRRLLISTTYVDAMSQNLSVDCWESRH